MEIKITDIQAVKYHRIVRLLNVKTGQERELIFGDSVSDVYVKSAAPRFWKQAVPIKIREGAINYV
ncbi:hypothetical protein [Paenibacillus wynnii]|uniref:KTSC domain-containing protein n=1 Tax=Paenibacillus wynnii TaxID=268407 RepID=A0A098MFI5_9BACL|nr:hypothetical protein [Paenibacillus wynnii]KGE20801.1 hypothetical protein PWYN_01065 [Paenibacillus wynnii]